MMKLKAKQRRKQKGASLILALIVLTLASLMVTGLLYYVNTSLRAHAKEVERMEARYAADAGVEWFAAQLLADEGPPMLQLYDDGAHYDPVDDTADAIPPVDLWQRDNPGETVNGYTPVIMITDCLTLDAPTSNVYVVTSTAGTVTTTATVTQRNINSVISVRVSTWDIA